MTDPTASHDTPAVREREALDQLSRVNGPSELHAVVLALLLPPGINERALRAWATETQAIPNARVLRDHVEKLSGPARLPCFEAMVSRVAKHPLATRQTLLEATRRVMSSPGSVRAIDRLHWLAMRRRLGELALFGSRAGAEHELLDLPESDVYAIAAYSAFLSRMVPGDAPTGNGGAAWYARVMVPWQPRGLVPPCTPPDADGMVHALQQLQALAFGQRPVLLRDWVVAAVQHSRGNRLVDASADALRLTAALLDCPMPPELARHFPITFPADLPEVPR